MAETSVLFRTSVEKLNFPQDFDKMTPWSKVAALTKARGDTAQIIEIAVLGEDLNILRTVKKAPPSVLSGVNSYIKNFA